MAKVSRYAAKRQEIMDMMGAGATYKSIMENLQAEGFPACYGSLYEYCQRLLHPRFTPAPHCLECKKHLIVDSAVKPGGHTYICMALKREVPRKAQTSPQWCPKRKGEEKNG